MAGVTTHSNMAGVKTLGPDVKRHLEYLYRKSLEEEHDLDMDVRGSGLDADVKRHLKYLYRKGWKWIRVPVGKFYCEWDTRFNDGTRRGRTACGYGRNNAEWAMRPPKPGEMLILEPRPPALYLCHTHYLAMTRLSLNPSRPGDVTRRDWCAALTALVASVEHSGLDVTEFVRKHRASVDRIIMRDAPHYPDRWEVA